MDHEINVYQRVSDNVCNVSSTIFGKNAKDIYSNINRSIHTPREKLCLIIDGISRNYNERFDLELDNNTIKDIVSYIDYIKKPLGYINAICFVLGYVISTGGIQINNNIFLDVKSRILPMIQSDSRINEADLIRYSRYIINLKKNKI